MSVQQLVDPEHIEPELMKLWENLAKEKMRACLFNLIVFNQLSPRTDYIRDIVKKVSEKYPCRVLFLSQDPNSEKPYIKTAVSVVGDGNIACDYIDIGVSGPMIEQVPFVLMPHLVPDLPISLLWTEDPSKDHPLFSHLAKLSTRVIFDSESADNILAFSKTILALREKTGIDTADLNWARTGGWRELLSSVLSNQKRYEHIKDICITYNGRKTDSFCHLKIQSMYLLAWLSSRLKWNFQKSNQKLEFTFEKQTGKIEETEWEKLGSGTVISIDLTTDDGSLYHLARNPKQYHHVLIHISSQEKCELPFQYILGTTATGQSLVKEIITKGTSVHYLDMLKEMIELDRDKLC